MIKKIYFAAPLFTEMETRYNRYVVDLIRDKYGDQVEIYLPQENESINDKTQFADSLAIAQGDNAELEEADILIAILDGVTPDSGLSAEIGYFYSFNRPILAIYSDSRQGTHGNQAKIEALDKIAESQFSYINLYTVGLVKLRGQIYPSAQDLVDNLASFLGK